MKILVIVFNLDPPYVDIGTPTRANDPWHSASSPTPRYIIIGLTPTTRRGSNRSSGRQSGVQEPIVVAASPPPTTSSASHLSISSMFPYYRLFSCLSFTVVIISRLLFCVRTVWQCLYVVRVSHIVQCILFSTTAGNNVLSPGDRDALVSAWLLSCCHIHILFIDFLCINKLILFILHF